ncbi:oligosaccharide biosynthesis protein Alg14 like protein [Opisthorchis viverrini]|uniref:UDP-N-acetylglucosamine transferase subunit ALG14 n=2 Tax=Opisthorchis viverrini TaxID=6198 RepID=A0A075A2T1_OPIVI|nr:hypothetical protein T265_03583 [Opisthorchis viverrini]KER29890.1 hypothetical protein T265_03583 [Opisthorchis viverrini]OON21449.1 oligosaccharide biosynthesis protein Alg14 like protein [Opisthorchis viverrini]
MLWLPCMVLGVFVVFTYIWMRRYFCSVHSGKFRTMVILGSGGHTAEMLPLVNTLTDKYTPRIYVVAATDKLSEEKVRSLCEEKGEQCLLERVPRAREVKQSPFTSIFSTLHEAILSLPIVFRHRPDLILCNGPGTCIPICFVAFFLRVIFMRPLLIVYIESICRTQTLSVSGQLLYYARFADVIVQWQDLNARYPRTKYLGLLS